MDQKSWVSPLTAVTFAAVAVTGILLLFHHKLAGVYPLHKWGGLLFVVAGAIHLWLNRRMFMAYFKKPKAVWGMVIGVLALMLITVAAPSDRGGHRYRGGGGRSFTEGHIESPWAGRDKSASARFQYLLRETEALP